jgi:hypothetical protein
MVWAGVVLTVVGVKECVVRRLVIEPKEKELLWL